MYYINQIVTRKTHLKLVDLVKQMKTQVEAGGEFQVQGVLLTGKDDKYYRLLKKILKFLGKIAQEDTLVAGVAKEVVFDLWLFFFGSDKNEFRESSQINRFAKSFLDKHLQALDSELVSDFLTANLPRMEGCAWKEFFELFKRLVLFVNEKQGKVQKDEVVLDGGHFHDYNLKKLDFFVLRVPSAELLFFPELESLFLSTRNWTLEAFLCDFLGSLLTKPPYASSETEELYRQEENKLIQRALAFLGEEPVGDFEFDAMPQPLVNQVKYLQLVNLCMGHGEPFGSGALKSFASVREGVPLLLNFEKENTYSTKTTTKFFFSNW